MKFNGKNVSSGKIKQKVDLKVEKKTKDEKASKIDGGSKAKKGQDKPKESTVNASPSSNMINKDAPKKNQAPGQKESLKAPEISNLTGLPILNLLNDIDQSFDHIDTTGPSNQNNPYAPIFREDIAKTVYNPVEPTLQFKPTERYSTAYTSTMPDLAFRTFEAPVSTRYYTPLTFNNQSFAAIDPVRTSITRTSRMTIQAEPQRTYGSPVKSYFSPVRTSAAPVTSSYLPRYTNTSSFAQPSRVYGSPLKTYAPSITRTAAPLYSYGRNYANKGLLTLKNYANRNSGLGSTGIRTSY